MIREARDSNFCIILESDSSISGGMWTTVSKLLSRKPPNEQETSYCIGGHETNDEFQIATVSINTLLMCVKISLVIFKRLH